MKIQIRLIIFVTVILSTKTFSQDLYFAKPSYSTQKLFSNFLANKIDRLKGDYLYVFHFPPQGCPRCEGSITSITYGLKARDSSIKTLSIISYYNTNMGLKYFENKGFSSEFVYVDKNDSFAKTFKYSSKEITIPYVYKIRVSDCAILYTSPLLGIKIDSAFITNLLEVVEPLTLLDSQNEKEIPEYFVHDKLFNSTIKVRRDSDYVSEPISYYYDFANNKIVHLDRLFTELCELDSLGKQCRRFRPNENEWTYYKSSDISDETFKVLRNMNILNIIYLKVLKLSDNKFSIIASLPKVIMEKDSSIGYFNETCLIERDKNSATVKINNIQWLGDTIDNLAIKHANSFYTDRYLCIPIIKGWPAIGTSNYIKEKDKSLDIFEKEFYKTSKLVALFDKLTLQFIANVGTLSNKTANLQSGFYYTSIRGTETPRSIVLSDGSGELQLVSKKNFKTTRVIIPPYESHLKEKEEGKDGTNSLLKLHTSEEKYYELRSKDFESPIEYLNSLSIFYENKIIEVKYFSKHLYVLIKNKAKNYQVLRLKVIRNKKLKLLGNIELKRNFDRSKQIQNIQFETNGNQIYLSSFYTEGESAFYGLKEITNAFQIIK